MCPTSLNLFAKTLSHCSHLTFLLSLKAVLSSSVILHNFSCLEIPLISTPQLEQVTRFFSPCLYFMWFFKPNTDSKHIWHWIFCCVCVRICVFRMCLLENAFEQTSHMSVFSSWCFMWTLKIFLLANVFEHISQRVEPKVGLEFTVLMLELLTMRFPFELLATRVCPFRIGYFLDDVGLTGLPD